MASTITTKKYVVRQVRNPDKGVGGVKNVNYAAYTPSGSLISYDKKPITGDTVNEVITKAKDARDINFELYRVEVPAYSKYITLPADLKNKYSIRTGVRGYIKRLNESSNPALHYSGPVGSYIMGDDKNYAMDTALKNLNAKYLAAVGLSGNPLASDLLYQAEIRDEINRLQTPLLKASTSAVKGAKNRGQRVRNWLESDADKKRIMSTYIRQKKSKSTRKKKVAPDSKAFDKDDVVMEYEPPKRIISAPRKKPIPNPEKKRIISTPRKEPIPNPDKKSDSEEPKKNVISAPKRWGPRTIAVKK